MVITDTVLELIKRKGPVIPSHLTKEIGQNIMMTGAVLSELSSRNKVKVSALKIGGSPLYYLPGQEAQLLPYINYLDPKEQKTLEKLQTQGVIRESTCDPLTRFTLKVIKDFSIPLVVRAGAVSETFYKYFLLSDDEAERQIREILSPGSSELPPPAPITPTPPAPITQALAAPATPLAQPALTTAEAAPPAKPQPAAETHSQSPSPSQPATESSPTTQPPIQTAPVEPRPDKPKRRINASENFLGAITSFFSDEHIVIEKETIIKKNTDHEYLLSVPSPVGSVSFYCHAKNKKRVTESDLATLLVKAQYHKLPGLLLTSGELTKKAVEMLGKELKGLTVKTL